KDIDGCFISIYVSIHDIFDVFGISPTHTYLYGHPIFSTFVEHDFIPEPASRGGQLQLTEFVRGQNINTCLVKNKIGIKGMKYFVQVYFNRAKYASSCIPSGNATSRSERSLIKGKFFSLCIENVKTFGWSLKIWAVPFP